MVKAVTCATCRAGIDPLEVFPGPVGHICLNCYAKGQENAPMPTAQEIAAMWGWSRGRRRGR